MSDRMEEMRHTIQMVLADGAEGGWTDQKITNEIVAQWHALSNGTDCRLYLGPAERMPHDGQMTEYFVRHVITDGDPVLDIEIRENDTGQQFFVRKIGDQTALDALPFATFEGGYDLPERIFFSNDDFKNNEYQAGVRKGYSLYTEVCHGLKPASIFEIGIRYGYSAWAMLRGCAPGTIYHGVDIRSPDYASAMLHEEYPQHQLRLARCDSGSLTHLSRTYDLAHVDGNHSHEDALHDLNLCWGRAKYILVDDIDSFCTVNSAINEFLSKHPSVPAVRYATQTGHVMIGPLPYLQNV